MCNWPTLDFILFISHSFGLMNPTQNPVASFLTHKTNFTQHIYRYTRVFSILVPSWKGCGGPRCWHREAYKWLNGSVESPCPVQHFLFNSIFLQQFLHFCSIQMYSCRSSLFLTSVHSVIFWEPPDPALVELNLAPLEWNLLLWRLSSPWIAPV